MTGSDLDDRVTTKDFSNLVAKIYQAGENANLWQECAEAASNIFDEGGSFIWCFDENSGLQESVLAQTNIPIISQYFEAQYELQDPLVLWALKNPDATTWHNAVAYRDRRPRDFAFNRWMWSHMPEAAPFGVTGLSPNGIRWAFSIIPWGRRSDASARPPIGFLHLIEPHVRNAFRMNRRLGLSAGAWDSLERLVTGVVFFDQSGQIIACNTSAQTMAAMKDGLGMSKHGLSAFRADETRALATGLQNALALAKGGFSEDAPERRPGVVKVSRPSGKAPFAVSFSPCPTAAALSDSFRKPAVMALIADHAAENTVRPEALSKIFGLTEAEAAVAAQIGQGRSVPEIAQHLKVTVHTIRFHLRSCFMKTGANAQKDLRAMVRRISEITR